MHAGLAALATFTLLGLRTTAAPSVVSEPLSHPSPHLRSYIEHGVSYKRDHHVLAARQGQQDAQTSLQLLESLVQPNLAKTGIDTTTDPNFDASETTVNNFINFCDTQKDVKLTNGGEQGDLGSCNPTTMGRVLAKDKMPYCKFQNPKNFAKVSIPFTIQLKVFNLETGHYVNPKTNYLGAPATTNKDGILRGHSHAVIQKISAFDSVEALDPAKFEFFIGLNADAKDNVLSAEVSAVDAPKLPPGFYKISSINAAMNHQPPLVATAKHGAIDDLVYFEIVAGGNNDNPTANPTLVTVTSTTTITVDPPTQT